MIQRNARVSEETENPPNETQLGQPIMDTTKPQYDWSSEDDFCVKDLIPPGSLPSQAMLTSDSSISAIQKATPTIRSDLANIITMPTQTPPSLTAIVHSISLDRIRAHGQVAGLPNGQPSVPAADNSYDLTKEDSDKQSALHLRSEPARQVIDLDDFPSPVSDSDVEVVSSIRMNNTQSWEAIRVKMVEYLKVGNKGLFLVVLDGLEANYSHFRVPRKYLPLSHSANFILGDGNCLFRCLSFWKYGHQDDHIGVREKVIEYANENRNWTVQHLWPGVTFDNWTTNMGKAGTREGWGDNTAMAIFAKMDQVILFVVSYTSEYRRGHLGIYYPDEIVGNNVRALTKVYFLLHIDFHFEIINPFFSIYVG
ncbi:OTU domain containing 3 [Puccinia graminis f. sp. tritici]|uniref:OTU domain containing 3 n=1 Tax=Puccinia graminis f. sp. tritici TaxID=56615 RepID=A0A5B0Q7U1_PUCGR|nr:OTU domain containing 3 [Puccinia graminis f. sp. tritici]